MQQMLEAENQNQPQPIGDIIKTLYSELSFGQKRRLLLQYTALYGNRSTFYRKLNKQVRLLRSEVIFFQTQLTQAQQPKQAINQFNTD